MAARARGCERKARLMSISARPPASFLPSSESNPTRTSRLHLPPSFPLVLRLAGLRSTTRDHERAGRRAQAEALLRKQAFPRSRSLSPSQTDKQTQCCPPPKSPNLRSTGRQRPRPPAGPRTTDGRGDRNLSKKHAHKRGRDAPSSLQQPQHFSSKPPLARSRSLHQLFPLRPPSSAEQRERESDVHYGTKVEPKKIAMTTKGERSRVGST